MLNHPFIEFIRSVFDVVESNWRYDDIFRLLKTGFIPSTNDEYPLDMDAIDKLENYVLEYGIRQKRQWMSDERWIYQRFRGFSEARQTDKEKRKEEIINAYRAQVVEALKEFDKKVRGHKTVRERCEIIYQLLEQLDIPTQLEKNREMYEKEGDVEEAVEEEQVWNGFIQLLDEMVEMIGDEKLSIRNFKEILEAGLEALEFSHVP